MEIFVISLRTAETRRAHVKMEMAAAGLPFRFFDAVEGTTGPESYFAAYNPRLYRLSTGRAAVPGEIGCYASHLALWKRCVELDEPIVVLEDDFHLLPGFAGALPQIDLSTREYGFVRLDSFHRPRRSLSLRPRQRTHKVRELSELTVYYLSVVPLCMLAYAIGPSAAAALVEASAELRSPVDKFLQRSWEHRVPVFGIAPPLVCFATYHWESTIGERPRGSRNPVLRIKRLFYKISARIRRDAFSSVQLRRLGLR